jgi:hypothetical protein
MPRFFGSMRPLIPAKQTNIRCIWREKSNEYRKKIFKKLS